MDVAEAIGYVGVREMHRRASVSLATAQRAKAANRIPKTPAGRRMRAVCAAEGYVFDDEPVDPVAQAELPLEDPLKVKLDKAALAWKTEQAAAQRRKNAEADGLLLPAAEVAKTLGFMASTIRTGMDALRRELEAQLPEDCRDALLDTYDAGVNLTLSTALEGMPE